MGRQRGATLLELMIALSVLSIAVLGVATFVRMGFWKMSDSKLRSDATDVIRQEVERLESLRFSETDLSSGTHQRVAGRYTTEWVVTNDIPVTGAKRLDVAVSWKDGLSRNETFRVTTYLVDRP